MSGGTVIMLGMASMSPMSVSAARGHMVPLTGCWHWQI